MTTVGVGAGGGTSDGIFARSDLRRGRMGLAVGKVGGDCRGTKGGRGGAEMSAD